MKKKIQLLLLFYEINENYEMSISENFAIRLSHYISENEAKMKRIN